jgi:hypothetical protein
MTRSTQVLVLKPMRSPTTGRTLGWGKSHTLDCWFPPTWSRLHGDLYVQMPASQVPPHVGRCSHCGGGR